MPCSASWSRSPMPDSISSCGLLIAPPHSTTSRRARTTCVRPSLLELDADGAVPVEEHPGGVGLGEHGQILPFQRGPEVGVGGAPPGAPALRDHGLAEALGPSADSAPRPDSRIPRRPSATPRWSVRGLRWRAIDNGPLSMRRNTARRARSPTARQPPRPTRRSRRRSRAPTSSRSSTTSRRASCLAANRSRARRAPSAARSGSPSPSRCETASRSPRGCGRTCPCPCGPASSTTTSADGSALSRLATTDPADPVPTTM